MKKSLLALSLTVLLFSCKKDEKAEFTATDVTGTTTVKGTVTKNIITPNGSGGWISTSRVPAVGVTVQIKINKNELYPNSVAQGADVYSATSDAQGNWSVNVKSTADGVDAYMTINGFNATLDTLINGVVKPGLYANFFGTSTSPTFLMGTTWDWGVYAFTASNLTSNPNPIIIGSAMVSGSVSLQHITKAVTTSTAPTTFTLGTTNIAIPSGTKVYMILNQDPTTLSPKLYQTTTDATGHYSFTFPTVASGTPGFLQNGTIWVADFAGVQDTVKVINAGTPNTVPGVSGVWNNVSAAQGGLYNNEIRNATNMALNAFTPN